MKKFTRDNTNEIFFGVCSGLARYFEFDVTLIRLLFLLFSLVGSGIPLLLYFLLVMLAPGKEYPEDEDVLE